MFALKLLKALQKHWNLVGGCFSEIRIVSQARWEFTKVESPHEICVEKKQLPSHPIFCLTFIIQELDKPH